MPSAPSDIERVESGLLSYGADARYGVNPFEAGLGAFAAVGTGFVGEEALKEHQPERRIVSILFDDADAIPIHDEPIYLDGRVVGQITSAAWSYRFGRSVALAIVKAPLDRLSAQDVVDGFEVEIACTRFTAKTSIKPAKESFG